jgi:methyl-accepting chemotaxis protein
VIREMHEAGDQIAEAVDEQSRVTNEISSNVAETAAAADQVSGIVAKTAEETGIMIDSIGEISTAAGDTARDSDTVRLASEHLETQAKGMQEIISRFRLKKDGRPNGKRGCRKPATP